MTSRDEGGRPKAIFFDAGNTLLRMNYAAIARELARHGIELTPDTVERAESISGVLGEPLFSPLKLADSRSRRSQTTSTVRGSVWVPRSRAPNVRL